MDRDGKSNYPRDSGRGTKVIERETERINMKNINTPHSTPHTVLAIAPSLNFDNLNNINLNNINLNNKLSNNNLNFSNNNNNSYKNNNNNNTISNNDTIYNNSKNENRMTRNDLQPSDAKHVRTYTQSSFINYFLFAEKKITTFFSNILLLFNHFILP